MHFVPLESDYNYTGHYQLPFTSAVMSNEVCVNITIKDDIILEPPEDIRLTLSSTHGSVQFQTAISDVTIIDNDCTYIDMHVKNITLSAWFNETAYCCPLNLLGDYS